MRRVAILLVALGVGFALVAGTALAGNNEWPEGVPAHGHVMLVGADINDLGELWEVSYTRCVELAAGEALRGPAHHHSVHTGAAGGSPFAPGALWNAGQIVLPLAPFGAPDWTGCDSFDNPWIVPDPFAE